MLSDDKVVAGLRQRPQTSQASAETDGGQPMETDSADTAAPVMATQPPAGSQTLAAKLSANLAIKRKAAEPPDQSGASDRTKSRR
jgi:hypothetical protein